MELIFLGGNKNKNIWNLSLPGQHSKKVKVKKIIEKYCSSLMIGCGIVAMCVVRGIRAHVYLMDKK